MEELITAPLPGEPGYMEWVEQQHIQAVEDRVFGGDDDEPWWSRGVRLN
jgi:hypothetical protein